MAVTWDKAMFDMAYDVSAEPDGHPSTRPEIRLHYHRYVLYPEALRRAQFFVQQFNLTSATNVLVVGCGFGWTVEALVGMGIPAVGTDVSPYIHGNKDLSEDSDIQAAVQAANLSTTSGEGMGHFNRLRGDGVRTRGTVMNEDHSNNASRGRVKRAFANNTIHLAISEDIVTSLTDAECLQVRTFLANYTVPICHFVTEFANPNPPYNFNSKSLADWKLMFPADTIIADGTPYRVA
jgi:hypothetical protein